MPNVPHADAGAAEHALEVSPGSLSISRHPNAVRALSITGSRLMYWLPVIAALVIFGQVSLLGLRPALSERARLKEAELVLQERYQRDMLFSQQIASHLAARFDPVFLERQRRSRLLAAAIPR